MSETNGRPYKSRITIALVIAGILALSCAVGCSSMSSGSSVAKKNSEISLSVPSDIVSYVSSIPEISVSTEPSYITFESSSETTRTITLDEFVEIVQEQIDDALNDGEHLFSLIVKSDENGMVYEYTSNTAYSESQLDAVTQEVDSHLEKNSSLYKQALTELRTATGENYNITVIYNNRDGSLIREKFFSQP